MILLRKSNLWLKHSVTVPQPTILPYNRPHFNMLFVLHSFDLWEKGGLTTVKRIENGGTMAHSRPFPKHTKLCTLELSICPKGLI